MKYSVNQIFSTRNKDRWGKGLFFKKEGHKTQLKKEIVFTILGAASCLLVLFNFGGVDNGGQKVPVPEYEGRAEVYVDFDKIEVKVADEIKKSKIPKQRTRAVVTTNKFSKMKIFERNFLGDLPEGTEAEARLKTDILPQTLVQAYLYKPLKVDGELILPKDTKVFGLSSEASGRMSVEFSKAVLPSGEKYKIKAFAHERKRGAFGLKGSQVGPRTVTALASTGLYFISGFSEGLIDRQMTENQVSMKGTLKNGLLNGASTASLEQSRQILSDLKNKQSVLRVSRGKKFKLVFYSTE